MKEKITNSVHIVGYLKENNLEAIVGRDGGKAIKGSVTIATSEDQSFKTSFYIREDKNEKEYNDLAELLPAKTCSILDYLKSTPTANFATAANGATKIWINGRLREFVSASNGREISMLQVEGYRAGFKQATDTAPFAPRATVECDLYIQDLCDEIDPNTNTETGRLFIDGYIPGYKGIFHKAPFYVDKTNTGCIDFIKENWKPGDLVFVKGSLVRLRTRVVKEVDTSDCFGSAADEQYSTRFVSEQIVTGGKKPYTGDDAVTVEEARNGLAARENLKNENASNKNRKKPEPRTEEAAPVPAVKKEQVKAVPSTDDFDF